MWHKKTRESNYDLDFNLYATNVSIICCKTQKKQKQQILFTLLFFKHYWTVPKSTMSPCQKDLSSEMLIIACHLDFRLRDDWEPYSRDGMG